jgi:hypothetical protein
MTGGLILFKKTYGETPQTMAKKANTSGTVPDCHSVYWGKHKNKAPDDLRLNASVSNFVSKCMNAFIPLALTLN